MATNLVGKAVVWGCDNIAVSSSAGAAIITSATAEIQSNSFSRESDKYDLRSAIGDVVGRAFFDHRKTIQVTCIPANGTNITTAKSDMLTMLPKIGTEVTIADADGTGTVIEINTSSSPSAKYTLEEVSVSRTNSGPAEISMTLSQREDNNVTTTIT